MNLFTLLYSGVKPRTTCAHGKEPDMMKVALKHQLTLLFMEITGPGGRSWGERGDETEGPTF